MTVLIVRLCVPYHILPYNNSDISYRGMYCAFHISCPDSMSKKEGISIVYVNSNKRDKWFRPPPIPLALDN